MEYIYTKEIDSNRLTAEIRASAITIAFDFLTTEDDDEVTIVFKDTLSPAEEAILDALVAAHVNEPLPDEQVVTVDLVKKTESRGLPLVALVKPDGNFSSLVSHDFCRKTSWYQSSTRRENQTLSRTANLLAWEYQSPHTYWVNLTSGNVTGEDNISTPYLPVIRVAGVVVTSGFSIDYVTGRVTFVSNPGGAVTADYSQASSSRFTVRPSSGKLITIERAEAQFSKDVTMSPISFEVWIDDPTSPGNKMRVDRTTYKNERDVINVANQGQGLIPQFGALDDDVLVFPFNYVRPIELRDSFGAELRVEITSGAPFGGSFTTVTFYTSEEDED